jgi:hypothetical protein
MSIIKKIIDRMPLQDYNNVKYTINFISSWLYELNIIEQKTPRKYKNLNNNEYKDLYNNIENYIYKTNFSFTTYETNKKIVIICFIKVIYNISLACAKTLYNNYKLSSNASLIDMIDADKELYTL